MFNTLQLNIAGAVPNKKSENSCPESNNRYSTVYLTDVNLKEFLGFFGGEHRDEHDSRVGFTCMSVFSDIPKDFDPGRFHILSLGVYVRLYNFRCTYFCGLLLHCGTPPVVPPGVEPLPEHKRTVLILYPNARMSSGTAVKPMFGMPKLTRDLGIGKVDAEMTYKQ